MKPVGPCFVHTPIGRFGLVVRVGGRGTVRLAVHAPTSGENQWLQSLGRNDFEANSLRRID